MDKQIKDRALPVIRYLLFLILFVGMGCVPFWVNSASPEGRNAVSNTRDPLSWPFAWDSIWNLPLGSGATYTPANISPATAFGMTVDEDIIILEPDAPQVDIVAHDAGWRDGVTRCGSIVSPQRVLIEGAPIPTGFSTDPGYKGTKPNHSAAILMADGVTLEQTQPFHRCGEGGFAVSQFHPPSDHIKSGDGIEGAHGGSGMSSIGGTIRLGELVPGGTIRHALKLNLYAANNLYYDGSDSTPGYRWPAVRADGYAGSSSSGCAYGGTTPALEMGALLALTPDFNIAQLKTEPARIVGRALQTYGGYVVDDTCWDVYALTTEWGPDGRVLTEFEEAFGYPMHTSVQGDCTTDTDECRWANDMRLIFTSLHVVDNNRPDSVGGPGSRLTSCAPPFADGTEGYPIGSVCDQSVESSSIFLPFFRR
ncbi:MAG: hypothetical protein AAF633_08225 [Chloroflexota bacterium]